MNSKNRTWVVGTLEGWDAWSAKSTYNLVTGSFRCTLVPKPFPDTMDLNVMKMHSSNFCNCFPFIPLHVVVGGRH